MESIIELNFIDVDDDVDRFDLLSLPKYVIAQDLLTNETILTAPYRLKSIYSFWHTFFFCLFVLKWLYLKLIEKKSKIVKFTSTLFWILAPQVLIRTEDDFECISSTDSFTFRVTDQGGQFSDAKITIDLNCNG